MATFSFEPDLFDELNPEEKEVIKPYCVSKKNGKTVVSQQFFYAVKTVDFLYKVSLLKVVKTDKKVSLLKRREGPVSPQDKWRSWEVQRESNEFQYLRETRYAAERPMINSVIDGWKVTDVQLSPSGDEVSSIEVVPSYLMLGHIYGGRLITSLIELESPVNQVISKLSAMNGGGCISGQKHETVVTCHASREPISQQYLNDVVFALDKYPHRKNKLEGIQPLQRGDYVEHIYFNEKGEYEGRDLTVAAESRNKGWEGFDGEYKTVDLGVSEKYKPLSLPKYYKEDIDKPDAPVIVNLSDAERKLKAMGLL